MAMDSDSRTRWIAANIMPCEPEVRRWVRRSVATLARDECDDVLQEAYARIWNTEFSRIANPRGYFFQIVRNLLMEQARHARIVPMERMGEIEALRVASEDPGPERRVTARQELERLCGIAATLPAKCRRVFNLRSFGGCSRREIAERLQISERTVEKHLAKAYLRITEAMEEDEGTVEMFAVKTRKDDRDAL